MRTFTLSALLIVAITLFSCTKDDSAAQPAQNCRLQRNVLLEEGTPVDSFNYQYNGQGQLTKVMGNNYDYALEYDGSKIVRRKYTHAGTPDLFAQDTITYNPSGTISEIKRVDQISNLVQLTKFTYHNNKLVALAFYDEDNELKAKYDYTYTINNITGINADESWNGVNRSFNYRMVYDTQPNNVKLGQQALLLDGFLSDHMGLSVIYVLSDNYVKSIEQSGFAVPVEYGLDQNKNITSIVVGGQPVMRGSYECL